MWLILGVIKVIILGKRIKELRLKNNMTQQQLGNLIGVTKVSICCYENGNRVPSLNTLVDLANVFKVDVDYLLGNDYQVSDNTSNYLISLSKEEIIFLRELKKYSNIYERLVEDPKRFSELIYKKLK